METYPVDLSLASTYPPDMSTKRASENMDAPIWLPDQPFNDLPRLPPAVDLESKAVLKRCITSRAALSELKQAAELIPNQSMLINTFPILEAQASSAIENIVTTSDKLFRFSDDASAADSDTTEALRYRQALMEGFRSLARRPLSTATAEAVCGRIKGKEMRIRSVPGTALSNAAAGGVVYTPPVGEETIRDLLANWERFLHVETAVDPLIRMAAGHYQFEAIHPFTDGNGRTGRVLNSLFLVEANLLTLPILYLSRFIIRQKRDYYRLLLDVTQHEAWEPWLLYMLQAVEETALFTTAKIAAIRSLAEHTVRHVRGRLPKIYSREIVDLLFAQPYCRIGNVTDAGIAKRQAASRYLHQLVEIGVLEEKKIGREKLFIHPRLMRLLTTDENEFEGYA